MKTSSILRLSVGFSVVLNCSMVQADVSVDAEVFTGTLFDSDVGSSHDHWREPEDPNITSKGTLSDGTLLFDEDNALNSPATHANWQSGDKDGQCGEMYFARTKITSPTFDPPVSKTDAKSNNCTPLIVDLGRDGILLGKRGVYVDFDLSADGEPETIQWVAPGGNEAFLALDLDGNGVIDDGSELFGDNTALIGRDFTAENGFIALAQYDKAIGGGNEDGVITDADAIWSSLVFWLDTNADGISTVDEVTLVSDHGFLSLQTKGRKSKRVDHAGNSLILWAWAKSVAGKHAVVDVVFEAE